MNDKIRPVVGDLYRCLEDWVSPVLDFAHNDTILIVGQYDHDFGYHLMVMVEIWNLRTHKMEGFEWQPSWFSRLE